MVHGREGWRRVVRSAAGLPLLALAVACGGGGGGGGGGDSGAKDLASVTPDALTAATESIPGDFAADLLRDTHFTSIVIEVDYPASRPPEAGALALLEDRFGELCWKPDGIMAVVDDAIPDAEFPAVSTLDDLDAIVATWRDTWPDQGTGVQVVYVLYAKGLSDLGSGAEEVIGLTWHGGTLAVFTDVVDASTSATVTKAEVEGTVLVHEGGHLLGLVNAGIPMVSDHEDPDFPGHDVDDACVMFWLLQLPVGTPNLGDPDFAAFDVHCRDDVEAFGGKPAPSMLRTSSSPPGERVAVGTCPNCRRRGLPARR